jgi:hypothetical protein
MPVWMVELFGSAQLNRAFWMMNLAVTPFWLAMILFPGNELVRKLSHPFFVPALLGLVYLYAVYLLVTVTGIPPLAGLELKAMRNFVNHPLVFLVVWAHYLAVDLFLGMSIYRDAAARKIPVPVELVLCWIFGPLGLMAYVLRLGWLKLMFR